MKKIPFALLAALIVIFTGCRSYTFLDVKYSDDKTKNKINPLTPKSPDSNYGVLDLGYTLIFNHEIKNNICQVAPQDTANIDKENIGKAEYRIIKSKVTRNPLWSLFCFATSVPLRVPALVGIPVGHRKVKTELAVDIKDADGNLIKTYTAKGKHISFITCYWGYKKDDAKYKAKDKSFYKAMEKIKGQMNDDAAFLNSKLPGGFLTPEEIVANKFIREGNTNYDSKNYDAAITNYVMANEKITAPKKHHAKFIYKLGLSYLEKGQDSLSMVYLNQALNVDPTVDFMAPVGLYLASKSLNDFDGAMKWLDYTLAKFPLNSKQQDIINDWKKEVSVEREQVNAGKALLLKPENVKVVNLGPDINGAEEDYFPSVTADESMLLFTSRRSGSTGGLGKDGKYDEDLWYCKKKENGSWDSPKNFGTPVNIKNNNGIASFTGDGQYVVCARCNEPDGQGSCDIYGATLVGNMWNAPVNLGSVINSKEWDAQVSISADGKLLVWASTREGGKGNQDIWISRKKENGEWSEPKNLGAPVNTSGNEYSPFLHPDGKTLYFSSNNLSPRIGGLDVYKTTLNEDGTCTQPENLGFPVNTEKNDMYFVLTPSGLKGYLASDRKGGFGGEDIYEIVYPEEKRSKLVTFVGNVLSDETKEALEANIKIEDLDSAKLVGEYISNSASGKFVVILTPGHNYSLTVSKNGYLFYSENFNLPDSNEFKEVRKEVYLQKIKEGKKIVLNNIFFETGKSELTETSKLEIQKLYELLNQNPLIKVEISGHTDNVGNDNSNMKLSQDRAAVVVGVLVGKGIPSNRLVAKGYGKTQPIALNDTDENRQLNRRTEFKILSAAE